MNKKTFILSFVALIIALGISQSVMAKEKKVNYLGHNYKGEVNDKKVPAGKGMMNVHGLMIEGVFDDHSVSNAIVWRTEYLGASNTIFSGTITYDESENIVLKAGGVIATKYYYSRPKYRGSLQDKEPDYAKETLKEDRIVNASTFETKELTLSYNVRMDVGQVLHHVKNMLHSPNLCASYTVEMSHANYYKGRVDMDVFATIEHYYEDKLIEPIEVEDYKDSEGRIWEYTAEPKGSDYLIAEKLIVKYPNGSYLEYENKEDYSPKFVYWEIHYPNGKIVETKWSESGSGLVYDMGKFKIEQKRGIRDFEFMEIFAKNVNKEKFIAPLSWNISITSDSIDFEKLSNSETEKFIREEVIPYIEDGTSKYVTYTTPNGKFKEGVFTSNKQAAAAEAKRAAEKAAVINKSIASFKKKYGFDPSIKNVRSIVKVGRNVLGVVNARNEWIDEYAEGPDRNETIKVRLVKDQGISKCYEFFSVAGAFYCGYFWTRNDVITSIHWGR